MKSKELAELLNGRSYLCEITKEEEKQAEQNNLIVIYGQSDDLTELRGAVDDEVGTYEGGDIYFDKEGLVVNDCGCGDDCPNWNEEKYASVEAVWDEYDYSWQYRTDIPHETFVIYEDGEKYCKGIVFSLDDVK